VSGGLNKRLERLTPEQRAVLEQRLLARRVEGARRNAVPRREVFSPIDLSYSQELMWLLSQFEDSGVAYNTPAAFRLRGSIDASVLERAVKALAERHEILRTRYDIVGDTPMQIIEAEGDARLTVIDLSTREPQEREHELHRILQEESEHPFDLSTDPVMRSTLVKLAGDDYVFLQVLHHVATDGYSRAIIFRDLTSLYDSIAAGLPSPLPELEIQYGDYAVWHRHWLDGGVLEQQLDYWKARLAGSPTRLELPTDFARPPVRSAQGDHRSLMLDEALREGLRAAGREEGATLFIALLAAFATLLHRYSGQDDIVVGTPFAGRNRTEFETMVGYFINPLALRVDLSGNPSFRTLLKRARETTIEAFQYADVPYEMVVNATRPERDMSQTPVFQAMMVLHNPAWQTERPKFQPQGTTATEVVHQKEWSKFDVLLGMSERQTGLNTTWEYSTDLFEHATIERMTHHFRELIASAVADPDRPLSRLSLLTQEERSRILVDWSQEAAPKIDDQLVKDLFEAQVERTPGAVAVVFEDQSISYEDLNRRANRLAHHLQAKGVGPGSLVAIFMEKSLDLVAAVLGVIKSGGAYVPVDPLYPSDRVEFMLEDAAPAVVLVEDHLRPDIPGAGEVLALDWQALVDEQETNPATSATNDDLAYVIYTSGSTGKPKGAMITNRSLASVHHAYEEAYGLADTTCHLQMASFSFDVFTGDYVRTLLAGRRLVLCPLTVVMDPPRLYDLMRREKVDCAEFVPAVATLLFDHVASLGESLDFMRAVIVSSEPWRNEKAMFFKSLCGPQTRLINSYGLTEATIDSTYCEVGGDDSGAPDRFVSIGRPLANTHVYVLDEHLQLVPAGLPGELCVGGTGVALGYLNRPDLTLEKFVPDPFAAAPGAMLYRTGDLARWVSDGNIEFLGRTDRQVKIRGFRIEPGEIEAVLERYPDVKGAAVIPVEDQPGDTWLAAYVEAADPATPPTSTLLREYLMQELPAFMVPSSFTVLDSLPLSPNGKVDRDALPTAERTTVQAETVAPRDEVERKLVEIWAAVLGIDDQIGVTDDFFALGGHSLLAVRVFTEIEKAFGVKLPLALLFQGATIERLAASIKAEQEEQDSTWSTIVPLHAEGTRRPLFLMHGIDGEVLFYRELVKHLDPDQPVYALQPAGLEGKKRQHLRLEDMAAEYVAAIQQFQPEGPYLLGGHCFSGIVAYEVARQLHEVGERTALLAVIDAAPLGHREQVTRIQLERQKFHAFFDSDLRGKSAWIVRRSKGLGAKIRGKWYWFLNDALISFRRPLANRVLNVHTAIMQARSNYVTPASPSRVTLFRAGSQMHESFDRIALWRRLAQGGVDVRQIGGAEVQHDNILDEPHVRLLAAEFNASIENAIADADPVEEKVA
jgi:amino acid adenylation domain-containing protein